MYKRMKAGYRFLTPVLLLLLQACAGNTSDKPPCRNDRLTAFRGLPPGFEGCTCYYSKTPNDFLQEQYIFVSDQDSSAYININGKPVKLRLKHTTRKPDAGNGQDFKQTYSNGTYTVVLKITSDGQKEDEAWGHTGDITVFFKDLEIEQVRFSGECGC